jgi:hypothetical protein
VSGSAARSGAVGSAAEAGQRVTAVLDAVLAVDDVVGLHRSAFAPPTTHLPGRTVRGLRIEPDRGEVHVVVRLHPGIRLGAVAARVREAATAVTGVPFDVVVGDVVTAESADPVPLHEGLT